MTTTTIPPKKWKAKRVSNCAGTVGACIKLRRVELYAGSCWGLQIGVFNGSSDFNLKKRMPPSLVNNTASMLCNKDEAWWI